jgi:hypothetical protein
MILGIDCSNYSGPLSFGQAQALRAHGIEFAIVGAQDPTTARLHLSPLRLAGIHCELYYYPLYDGGDHLRIDRAANLAHQFGAPRLWADVEWNTEMHGPEPGPATVLPALDDQLGQIEAAKLKAGIYTGQFFWQRMTGNATSYAGAGYPLWHAWYWNDSRVPDFDDFRPYGGWRRPLIWQYRGTHRLEGFSVDANAAEHRFWLPQTTLTTQDLIRGLIAAAFVISIDNPLSDLSPEDRAAVRQVAKEIPDA